MAFAAFIAAYQEAEDGDDRLRALLPLAGRTLLEHQVRRAVRAGASHVVILVERLPAALNAALDRLRRDKLPVEIARDPSDAAGRLHPGEDVLVVADGLVASHACFERVATSDGPALLVVEDIGRNEDFERIDANWRWAGLALTDAETLRETADMVGDWDMQSTLLRRIVQGGAAYVTMAGEEEGAPRIAEPVLADRQTHSLGAGRAMLGGARARSESWPERYLFPPVIALVAPSALDRSVEPFWLRVAAMMLTLLAAFAFWSGWLWTGMLPALIAGPLCAIARRIDLARLRDRSASWETRFGIAFAQALVILAVGRHFSSESGDGLFLLASAVAVAMLLFCERERATLARLGEAHNPIDPWIASRDGVIWLLPVFAILGQWAWWPLAAAIYAGISLFALQFFVGEAARGR